MSATLKAKTLSQDAKTGKSVSLAGKKPLVSQIVSKGMQGRVERALSVANAKYKIFRKI